MLPDKKPDKQTIEKRLQAVPDFNSKCFVLFRQWTKRAKRQFPKWEPDIKHEQEILDEVRDSFKKGVKETFKEKGDQYIPGYLEGFLAGFVQGSLTTAWSVRYLPKPDDYMEVLWLKSIRRYLALPIEAAEHINRLFTAFDQSNMLFQPGREELSEEDIALYQAFADINFEENHRAMLSFLERLELQYIHKFMDKMPKVEVRDVMDIFEKRNIEFILLGKPN